MASFNDQKVLFPYMNEKDCSLGFCTFYCLQWCHNVYPPPPLFEFPEDNSNPSFSPLVIAIIAVLASAFLLVSYYTLISKYCGSRGSSPTQNHAQQNEELEQNHNPSLHDQPWQAATPGLGEALIKTITVCKYKKEDGLVEMTDCSVCLCEFEEDEDIRLLPKCSHAFHLPCIDTWLKSHSNCPLCRANIFCFNTSSALGLPTPPVTEIPSGNEDISETQNENEVSSVRRDHEMRDMEEGNSHGGDAIIDIKNEGCNFMIRRSISMDHSLETVSDAPQMHQVDEGTHLQDL